MPAITRWYVRTSMVYLIAALSLAVLLALAQVVELPKLLQAAGGDVEFRTLPVLRYENIDGQDVNIVDPAAIRSEISAAIAGSAAPTTTEAHSPGADTVIAVVNGSQSYGLASRTADVLSREGFTIGEIRDRKDGEPPGTVISYGPGGGADATTVADLLGVVTAPQEDPNLDDDQIRIILGDGFDPGMVDLGGFTPESVADSAVPGALSGSDDTITPIPDAGVPIDGGGVPCVN